MAKYAVDTDYSALTEEIEANPKARKCNVGDRVRLTKYKNSFSLSYTKIKSREILIWEICDSMLKTNPRTYKIKQLNIERVIRSFYEK